MGVVESTADAGEGIHEHKDILTHFDEAFCAVDGELRNAGMGFDIAIVRASHEFGCGNGAANLGDFLWAFINQKDDKLHFRMVFHHGIRDVLKKGGFSRAGWSNDKATLTFANGSYEIDDSCRVALRNGLQNDALIRVNRSEFFKDGKVLVFIRVFALKLGELVHLRPAISPASLATNPHAITKSIFAHDFWRNKNVVVRLGEIALRFA